MRSSPVPGWIVSLPVPASIRSLPVKPNNRSLPASPNMVSPPPPPSTVSFPRPARIESAPAPGVPPVTPRETPPGPMESKPLVPRIVAMVGPPVLTKVPGRKSPGARVSAPPACGRTRSAKSVASISPSRSRSATTQPPFRPPPALRVIQ